MTNNNQNFELAEINTYYVPSDDYFTFEGDLKTSNFICQFILSSHVLLNYDETLVSASENILTLFESADDICSLYTGTYENCQIIPNNFDIIYREFHIVEEDKLNIKLSGLLKLSKDGQGFKVYQPKKNSSGINEWKFGSVYVSSILLKQSEDSFEITFNLENENFMDNLPIIEMHGKEWSQKTDPFFADSSKTRVTMNVYEDIKGSEFDINFKNYIGDIVKNIPNQDLPAPDSNILYED